MDLNINGTVALNASVTTTSPVQTDITHFTCSVSNGRRCIRHFDNQTN